VLRRALILLALTGFIAASIGASASNGASAGSTVGAEVLTAVQIDSTGCSSGVAGRTAFGSIPANSSNVTTTDCTISFGSSNGRASLRIRQTDQAGAGMHTYSTGNLDTTFDGPTGTANGEVNTILPSSSFRTPEMYRLADGRFLVAGEAAGGIHVGRFDAQGVLDPTFDGDSGSGNGIVVVDPTPGNEQVSDVVQTANGDTIIVASTTSNELVLIRLNADGTLDTGFDGPSGIGNGVARITLGGGVTEVYGGELHTEDVLATINADGAAYVARIDGDAGTPDLGFDGPSGVGNGFVAVPGAVSGADTTLTQSGMLVFVGESVGSDQVLARLHPLTGLFDATFDGPSGTGNGVYTLAGVFAAPGLGVWALEQSDGKLLIVQGGDLFGGGTQLRRYLANGDWDVTYDGAPGAGDGEDGEIGILTQARETTSATLQPDDKLLVGGLGVNGGYSGVVARIGADGTHDPTFSPGATPGWYFTQGGGGLEIPSDFELLDDGTLLAVANGYGGGTVWLFKFDSTKLADYNGTTNTWSSQMFGTCLRSTSGATTTWTSDGTCDPANGTEWRAIPTAWDALATSTTVGDTAAQARLRFGLRAAPSTTPGSYYAPITFSVVAV
jgi:hypothetical protein